MKYFNYILFALLMFGSNLTFGQNYWSNITGPFGGAALELKKNTNGNFITLRNDGLYNSTDNGDSWNRMNEGMVNANLCMDISQSGIIYTGKSTGGIWWTGNSGQSWNFNPISVAPHSGTWASVVIVKVNPAGHVYINNHVSFNGGQSFSEFNYNGTSLVSRDYVFNNSNHVYSATQNGIYYSSNNASSWTNISGNLPSVNAASLLIDGNNLFAGITGQGVYMTSDNGVTWIQKNNGITDNEIIKLYKDQLGSYYAGTSAGKVFRSADQGNTWEMIFESNSENRINSIYSDGSTVFLSTSIGIYKSVNNGSSWSSSNTNLTIPLINSLTFPDNNKIMAATGTGIFYSENNGISWERREDGLPTVNSRVVTKISSSDILTGLRNYGIYRTPDNGMSWQPSGQGLPQGGYVNQIIETSNGFIFSSFTNSYSGDTMKIYRSSDNGNSWIKIFQPESNLFNTFKSGSNGKLYIVSLMSFPGEILTSSDNGNSWTETELTQFFFPDKFAVSSDDIYIVSSGIIYKSSDDGINWTMINGGGWQNTFLNAFELNRRGDLFVSQGTDFFVSTNEGQTWEMQVSGLIQNSVITNLTFDDSDYLYGTAYYYGIFKSTQSTITNISGNISGIPRKFSLSQNYPNPFNPKTIINYKLGITNDVSIKVYDILGNEVALLVNKQQDAGRYSVEFDGSNIASGIYFYTLETENFKDTRRMILLK